MSNPIPTVLMLAFPATGHVNPLLNIALKLVQDGCQVIFVNTDFTHKQLKESINGLQIKFVSIPDGLSVEDDRTDAGELCLAMMNTMPAMLEKLIEDIHLNGEHRISCIVADVAMGWGMKVANKLGIKGALLWTASAAMFALTTNIPMLIDNGIIDSEGMPITKETFQLSPSMTEMDTRVIWWSHICDSITEKKVYNYFFQAVQNLNLTDWWLCNTTYELEPATLSFIPKLLPVGPLLRSHDNSSASARSLGQFWAEDLSCMTWLDQQPHGSVLYVAFGSSTLFDQTQFTELALGLKLTNRPFLWVVRQDYNRGNKIVYPSEFNVSHGKIVEWAPQQMVLSHPAIACFVSHCGWNSTIEGLSNGVPFLSWPYYTDQFYNKTFICDELKLGLSFDSDENGLVSCGEIKRKVDQLLNNENILGPIRPPPKPPDAGKSFNLSNVVAAGSSVGAFLCMLVLRLGCVKYAPGVFDGKPQQIWAFLENIVHTGPYEADNYFCILSKYQSASKQRVNLDNVETTFSRNEPEKDKEMILNWIVEKTVDSHFLDVFDRVWKIMIGQLLGSRYGFSFAHLVSVQSMCNVAHVSIGLAVRGETSLWMGNAPTQPDQSLCIDLYFI